MRAWFVLLAVLVLVALGGLVAGWISRRPRWPVPARPPARITPGRLACVWLAVAVVCLAWLLFLVYGLAWAWPYLVEYSTRGGLLLLVGLAVLVCWHSRDRGRPA